MEIEVQKKPKKSIQEEIKVKSTGDIFNLPQVQEIKDAAQEHLLFIGLDCRNNIRSLRLIGVGSTNMINIDSKEVVRDALLTSSDKIVLVHNHPSNSLEPSKADIHFTNVTRKLLDAFNIQLLDHVIVTEKNYFSMEKERIFNNSYEDVKINLLDKALLLEENNKLKQQLEDIKSKSKGKFTIELSEDEMIKYYANKIVEDSLSDTFGGSYSVELDNYNDNGFIKKHQLEIVDIIERDNRVLEVYIDEKNKTIELSLALDYCPNYYDDYDLSSKEEQQFLQLFIDSELKIENYKEYEAISTTRSLIRNFMNKYIENNDSIEFDDKDAIYNSIKKHICNIGFVDKYLDKYEVYVTKYNIDELKNGLEKEIQALNNEIEQEEQEEEL